MIKMRTYLATFLLLGVGLAHAQAPAGVNPHLKDIHKIYVSITAMRDQGGSEVREKVISRIASSGRFTAATSVASADAVVTGKAGSNRTEENGKKYVTGFANLKLIDPKAEEIVWTFEYRKGKAGAAHAADRVADQFIEKLLADAKIADEAR